MDELDQDLLGKPSSIFGSSGSAASLNVKYKKCTHSKGSGYFCKECWKEHNALRRSRGLPDEAYRGFCEHGINYRTQNSCREPQCQTKPRPSYGAEQEAAQQSPLPVVASTASADFELNPHNPRGLSFSDFESVNPMESVINRFGDQSPLAPVLPGENYEGLLRPPLPDRDDHDKMGGRSKSYRKSARKPSKKTRKSSSRKVKMSSRKARKSSRKAKRLSRR
jgi:hypothetical protein